MSREQIIGLINHLIADTSVPKNVRACLQNAKTSLTEKQDLAEAVSGAIYSLDEVSNDLNLPMHARTMIWNVLSDLEKLKEESTGSA